MVLRIMRRGGGGNTVVEVLEEVKAGGQRNGFWGGAQGRGQPVVDTRQPATRSHRRKKPYHYFIFLSLRLANTYNPYFSLRLFICSLTYYPPLPCLRSPSRSFLFPFPGRWRASRCRWGGRGGGRHCWRRCPEPPVTW